MTVDKRDFQTAQDLMLQRLTMDQIISRYTPRKITRSSRCRCRLHDGKDNNLRLYGNRFKCFVCGAHGDFINYVSLYFGISYTAAMRKIDKDFELSLLDHSRAERDPVALTKAQTDALKRAELRTQFNRNRERAAENYRYWLKLYVDNEDIITRATVLQSEDSDFQRALRLRSYIGYRVENAERIMREYEL